MQIRPALPTDAAAITGLYNSHVEGGFATFDTEPRPVAEWEAVIAEVEPGHHVLVATDGDDLLGYAKSGGYSVRPAYGATVLVSVYVTTPGRGVGDALYTDLLARLEAGPAHVAVAHIALPNPASVRLHDKHGFAAVGVLHEVGWKHGAWRDVALHERRLD